MNKSKITWIFVIALIVAIPFALAQGITGAVSNTLGNWKFFLANAAVIALVLFIIQAILIPQKSDKEKSSTWLIVVGASLMIAWFYGRAGYLWQAGPIAQFFNMYVIVNALIIGTVLYLLLGMLQVKEKLGSKEGNYALGILVFIISALLAVKIGQKWIWSEPAIATFVSYLFNPTTGILNPNAGLWVFVSAALLISFFFNNFLLKEQKNPFVNYALAVLIAANMASTGTSFKWIVRLGEMIFFLILYNALETSISKENWITRLLVAGVLVGWASNALTSGNEEYRGLLGSIFGMFTFQQALTLGFLSTGVDEALIVLAILAAIALAMWLFGKRSNNGTMQKIGSIGLILLLIIAGIIFGIGLLPIVLILLFALGGIGWVIFRGERKGILGELKERYGRHIWNDLKVSTESGILNWLPFIGSGWHKRETPKGMFHPIIMENLDIFHALMGYMKRIFIFLSKWKQVTDAGNVINNAYSSLGNFNKEPVLINQIKAFRTGGEIYNVDSKGNKIESNEIQGGLFGSYEELIRLINAAMEITSRQLTEAAQGKITAGVVATQRAEYLKSLATQIGIYTGNIETYFGELKNRIEIYGNNHVIKAWMYLVLDQVNPSGARWPHTYFFIPKGTIIVDEGGNKSQTSEDFTQVNMFGELMEDIFDNMDQFLVTKDPNKKPRKVKDTRTIMAHPDPYLITKSVDNEWMGFMKDLTYGDFHPWSRSWPDYERFLNENSRLKFNDDELVMASAHLPSKKDATNPAFDREALKNPGQFIYWGRNRWSDGLSGIEDKNPYPTLTAYGMTMYLLELTEKDIKDKSDAHRFQSMFLGHSGEWTQKPAEAKRIVTLMSKVAKKGEH